MAIWSSALDFEAHPAVGYFIGRTLGVRARVTIIIRFRVRVRIWVRDGSGVGQGKVRVRVREMVTLRDTAKGMVRIRGRVSVRVQSVWCTHNGGRIRGGGYTGSSILWVTARVRVSQRQG